ncbi:hypothetical protein CBS470a_010935 [Colletotrichum nupharicola]|nr:hypothetical protein CBS470a_010935 [Colletotrichum nupharicola]
MSERTDIDDEEKINYFTRHLVDPTDIAQERFLCLVVERVRETAVSLAVLGLVAEGTRLLEILHSHGIPPFDLYELGPEKRSEDYDKSCYLAKGDTEKYADRWKPKIQTTAVRGGQSSAEIEEKQDQDEVIDEFFLDDDDDAEKDVSSEEIKDPEDAHQYNINYINSWGKAIAENHYAQDQLPMLGCMRRLWQRGWFEHNATTNNTLVKELDIDVDHIRRLAQTGCAMLTKRLETGPNRPYAGATVAELVRAIDENTRANAPYWPEHNSEERIAADAGGRDGEGRGQDHKARDAAAASRPVSSGNRGPRTKA